MIISGNVFVILARAPLGKPIKTVEDGVKMSRVEAYEKGLG
jgi:hypothetical protein